jgi:hypothetical protein
MVPTTATLDLSIWRNDDVYEYPLRVIGPNLTGVSLRAQIRSERDVPGPARIALETVTNGNAEGVRLASAIFVDGRWVNDVRIRINKSSRQALPYFGDFGDTTMLRWALAIGGRTRIDGRVFVLAHAMDSDNAPLDRTASFGLGGIQGGAPSSGATLTITSDSVAELVIDGADLVERTAATSQDAAARSEVAAAQAGLYATTALGAIGGMMYLTLAAGAAANPDGKPFSVIGDGTNTYAILYTAKHTLYDFRNGALPAGTAIRRAAGPWSRTKADKVMEQGTAADTARFNYDEITGASRGVLVEPPRTNFLPSSTTINSPPWIKLAPATIVTGQADPFGGTAASLVTHPAGSLNGVYYTLGGAVAGALYGQSVYTKRPAGSTATAHQLITNASAVGGTGTNSVSVLSTSWTRHTVVGVATNNTTMDFLVSSSFSNAGGNNVIVAATAGDHLICGAQLELIGDGEAQRVTTYIPTAGAAATRPGEILAIQNGTGIYRVMFDNGEYQDLSLTPAAGVVTIPGQVLNRYNVATVTAMVVTEVARYASKAAITSIYGNLADLKKDTSAKSRMLIDGAGTPVPFTLQSGDFSAAIDGVNVIAMEGVPATSAALVRQSARSFTANPKPIGAPALRKLNLEDAHAFGVRLTRYGFKGNGSADDTQAWRDAITEATDLNIRRLIQPMNDENQFSLVTGKIVDGFLPFGLSFEGEGRHDGNANIPGRCRIMYAGTGACWDIRVPFGVGAGQAVEAGRWSWRNMHFQCSDGAGSMFDFQRAGTYTPVDGSVDGYAYLTGARWESCFFLGKQAGAAQTGDAIKATKCFSFVVDKMCQFQGWRRGVSLLGADDWTVEARFAVNTRSIHHEARGTFGSNLQIHSNWLSRAPKENSETPYSIYDTGNGTSVVGTFMEGTIEGGVPNERAGYYMGGFGTHLVGCRFADLAPIEVGAGARECMVINPGFGSYVAGRTAIVNDPASWDWGFQQEDFRVSIVGASKIASKYLGSHPRLAYLDRQPQLFDSYDGAIIQPDQDVEMLVDSRGYRPRQTIIAPHQKPPRAESTIVATGFTVVQDAGASRGWAYNLANAAQTGLAAEWRIGSDLMRGDTARIQLRARSGSASGWQLFAFRNGTFISAVFGSQAITGASFSEFLGSVYLDPAVWQPGDVLMLAVLQASAVTGPCLVDYLHVAPSAPAVAAPSGGTVVDVEARAQLNLVIQAMRARGDLSL